MGNRLWQIASGILLLLLSLTLFGCAPTRVTLGANDAGRKIELKRNQFLEIALEGNPSTGYSWSLVDVDAVVMRQVSEPSFTPEQSGLGVGGIQTFRFRAINPGQTTIKLTYRRPWENAVAPLKSYAVEVVVRR